MLLSHLKRPAEQKSFLEKSQCILGMKQIYIKENSITEHVLRSFWLQLCVRYSWYTLVLRLFHIFFSSVMLFRYQSHLSHLLIGGFLPFTAISVELYYVFLTLWGRHLYTLYGILSCVFAILLIVTACVSITLTYFQLSMYVFF